MLGDTRQRCAGLRLALHSAAGREAKGEDEDGKTRSDQRTGMVAVTQRYGSEEGSCKFKGPEEGVKSAETSF